MVTSSSSSTLKRLPSAATNCTRSWPYRHSGYPGGLKSRTIGELLEKHPDRVVEKAIVGMIPKNKLGRQIKRKLHVYAGPQHPHAAQQPTPYEIKQVAQMTETAGTETQD